MRQKHCWTYSILRSTNRIWLKAKYLQYCFCLKRQNINIYFAWADQDWIGPMIFKIWRIRTGSDSILSDQDWIGFNLSDQDWTRTEKFQNPLISAA